MLFQRLTIAVAFSAHALSSAFLPIFLTSLPIGTSFRRRIETLSFSARPRAALNCAQEDDSIAALMSSTIFSAFRISFAIISGPALVAAAVFDDAPDAVAALDLGAFAAVAFSFFRLSISKPEVSFRPTCVREVEGGTFVLAVDVVVDVVVVVVEEEDEEEEEEGGAVESVAAAPAVALRPSFDSPPCVLAGGGGDGGGLGVVILGPW